MRTFLRNSAALALFATAVAGCSNSNSDSTAPATSGGPPAAGGSAKKLTIAWAQWKPSDYLQELAKDYTKESGVEVSVEQIPWPQYQQKIETSVWTGHSNAYDMIVGDSQWLGRGATEGHYVDLTDWSKQNVPWDEISPAAKQFYCEYNGKIWAVPCESDAIGFAYRKDMFEDPANKAAYKAQFKRDLAPPATWSELKDIAQFFTHPDKKQYGVALFYAGGGGYDGITMGFDQVLWCNGGDLRDPKTGKVQGVINSPASISALDLYTRQLKQFTPPGSENFYYDETLKAFTGGQVAMAMDWFTFFPGLLDKATNPLLDKTGFFVSPAGPAGHFVSLGGQGLSISSYSTNQDAAKAFLAWFSKRDTQAKWAKLGGLTQDQEVLKSADFKNAAPFNATFAATVPFLKDFYNNPKYAALLEVTQVDWNSCVTGQMTPKQAMDDIATKHTQILTEAGALK